MDQPVSKPQRDGLEKPIKRDEGAPHPPVRERQRASLIGIVLTLLIVGGVAFAAYQLLIAPKTSTRDNRAGSAPQSVGVATAARGDVTVELDGLGTVTPLANITVKTQINGQLMEVGFTEGQTVKKDDFLAQIDPRPYEALEHQYEGQLARDQGLLAQAKVDLVRYQTLAKLDSIARQQAEDQQFLVQQDEGTVRSDEGLIEAQKVNLTYCHIIAPVGGRVGLRQVDPGNYVQTTDANGLVVLTQLRPISVVFSIPENVAPKVFDAIKTNPKLDADAYDQANTEKLSSGRLAALDNVIDTTTGMLKARAIFDNPDDHLVPNQFVNIHLKIGLLHDVVTAPTAAVQRGSPGTFVYVVGADNKVSVHKITIGPTQGSLVAVTAGLEAGDRVVIDGSDQLREGARVVVAATTASAADGAAGMQKRGGGARDKP